MLYVEAVTSCPVLCEEVGRRQKCRRLWTDGGGHVRRDNSASGAYLVMAEHMTSREYWAQSPGGRSLWMATRTPAVTGASTSKETRRYVIQCLIT
jgi:hypothetical protein